MDRRAFLTCSVAALSAQLLGCSQADTSAAPGGPGRVARKLTIKNGGVILPVTVTGQGRKLIFFNGVGATQVIWKSVIGDLKGQYEVVTFDFRSHGEATTSADHSFDAFESDADAVMAAAGSEKPIVVAWSFGADLALAYAVSHPRSLGGLVIVDGAVPISAPLVQDAARMRRKLNGLPVKLGMLLTSLTPYKYALSGDDIADIALDADARRQHLLEDYGKVDCPISMLLATKTAGENKTEHAKRNNKIWREGGERLAAKYSSISVQWLDSGHNLPQEKPALLAGAIDAFASNLGKAEMS